MTLRQEVLQKYLTPCQTFIETGTRWGDTCRKAMELGAGKVVSIEYDLQLFEISRQHLSDLFPDRLDRITILLGSSDERLLDIMPDIREAAVIFLDAHTDTYSPVMGELDAIRLSPCKQHTILVDDMRVFRAGHWGASEDQIIEAICRINGDYQIRYEDGVEERDILVAQV